jgi:hypothetical protein
MLSIMLVRFNLGDQHLENFLPWYDQVHRQEALAVPGITSQRLYEAVYCEGRIWTYQPVPRFTLLSHLSNDVPLLEIFESSEFLHWWTSSVLTWSEWTADARWTVCRQVVGPVGPVAYDRLLLTQEDVSLGHEEAWTTWYDTKHITDAAAVPGEFGADYRRFTALDVATSRWRCAAKPMFSHIFEVRPDIDLETVMTTPEFETMAADTMANWSAVLENAVSTMCKRVF